jgi:hypothetical protein
MTVILEIHHTSKTGVANIYRVLTMYQALLYELRSVNSFNSYSLWNIIIGLIRTIINKKTLTCPRSHS